MEFGAGRRLPILQHSNTPILHYPITPIPNTYGFTEKTAQSENQQTQTAQEAPRPSSQEAHVAEVRLPGRAERRGFRPTKASLRSAGQAGRLPYVGGTGKLRPAVTPAIPSCCAR